MPKLKSSLVLLLLVVSFFIFLSFSYLNALSKEDIVFPVAELGNCRSEKECKTFCDSPDNFEKCIAFAEKYSLMSDEEIETAKKFGGKSGPGSCRSQEACEIYCEDTDNIEECLSFAEKNNIIPAEELKEAKKVAQALRAGAKLPGGCKNKKDCESYCENPDKVEECVLFAEAAGFMSKEEAEMVRKTGGKGPGDCKGKAACENYCNEPSNMEECINFAVEHDIMPAEEREEALKAVEALKKGVKLPNCRGKKECDVYCSQPENMMECVTFAEAAGFMSPEEAEEAKKMAALGITSGPGGCRGKNECEDFCDNPDNFEICISFAEEHNLMSKEEAEMARKTGGKGPGDCKGKNECEAFCEEPSNQEECFNFAVEHNLIPPEELEQMKKGMEMMKRGGPGGCKSREECETFCADPANGDECMKFAEREGLIPLEELENMKKNREMMQAGGPGGCRSQEECEMFCSIPENQKECFNFAKEKGMLPPEELQEIEERMEMMREGNMMRERREEMMGEEEMMNEENREFMEEQKREMMENREFRPPEEFEEFNESPDLENMPIMPEDMKEQIFQQEFQQEFEKQYQEEFQRRIEEMQKLQQQQSPYEQSITPGQIPSSTIIEPAIPQESIIQPPATPLMQEPINPSDQLQPPPSSQIQTESLLSIIIQPFLEIFRLSNE